MSSAVTTDYVFAPSTPTDSRAPCPGLNALANHGYLPRDGMEIGYMQLTRAIQAAYNFSLPFALLLSAAGFVTCSHFSFGRNKNNGSFAFGLRLNLGDLAVHRTFGIEHNASLSRRDVLPGESFAPVIPDVAVIEGFILKQARPQYGLDSGLSIDDFVQARLDREAGLIKPLDPVHAKLCRGESAFTLLALRDENIDSQLVVPAERLKQWYGEDRLPDGYKRPKESIGLIKVLELEGKINGLMKQKRETNL